MKKYRQIEVHAFRRRVTIVSGEWPRDISNVQPERTVDGVSLNDIDSCEPVETDSPEGQLLIVEAVSSLERRLSPEFRGQIWTDQNKRTTNGSNRDGFYLKLQSLYQLICTKALRFAQKEK